MRWIMITKTTMVIIFNLQNSHLLTLSLPKEKVFQVNDQNRPVANLPVVDFHSQPREMLTPKPLNTQLSVFLLVYWFSSSFRRVWTSLSVSDTDFGSISISGQLPTFCQLAVVELGKRGRWAVAQILILIPDFLEF